MHIVRGRNVNITASEGLHWLKVAGEEHSSRNGRVLVAPGPVISVYEKPCERVLFSAKRDANPFFHLMESLWMLGGRNDVAWLSQFNSNIHNYSDDGETFWGAYGHRWLHWFKHNQLKDIIAELKARPDSRRCVLSMWDGEQDMPMALSGGKDVPCNTHAYFEIRRGVLNMTVCNRSNDAIWGCYGANVVHFSVLQEYVASCVGVPVGDYVQFSNNFHAYMDRPDFEKLVPDIDVADYYSQGVKTLPLMTTDPESWHVDLQRFLSHPFEDSFYVDPFFNTVAKPMARVWKTHKEGNSLYGTLGFAKRDIAAEDWRLACCEWLQRRIDKKEAENAG